MKKSLDTKLERILADPSCDDFLLADAKDADMALGLAAPGLNRQGETAQPFRTLQEYRELIRQNVEQGLLDIMLMSVSTSEALTIEQRVFEQSPTTPAVRANDATDIWMADGGVYRSQPALPFRTAVLEHAQYGSLNEPAARKDPAVDLGLYSITYNNHAELDARTLSAYRDFRIEAEQKGFRHFLEVFDPNCPQSPVGDVGRFINDNIARTLAGVAESGRPLFLKIAYHGPAAMEQLVRYDRSVVVGILGGQAGTTFDAFGQLWEAKKYGARVALYGRMINHSEHQPSFIQHLRWLADGDIDDPGEAVRSYHGALQRLGISPYRSLDDDLSQTVPV